MYTSKINHIVTLRHLLKFLKFIEDDKVFSSKISKTVSLSLSKGKHLQNMSIDFQIINLFVISNLSKGKQVKHISRDLVHDSCHGLLVTKI